MWMRVAIGSLDGKIVGTLPSKTSPVNQGKLCIKGWDGSMSLSRAQTD